MTKPYPKYPWFLGFEEPCRFEGELYDCIVEGEIPSSIDGTFYRTMPDPSIEQCQILNNRLKRGAKGMGLSMVTERLTLFGFTTVMSISNNDTSGRTNFVSSETHRVVFFLGPVQEIPANPHEWLTCPIYVGLVHHLRHQP